LSNFDRSFTTSSRRHESAIPPVTPSFAPKPSATSPPPSSAQAAAALRKRLTNTTSAYSAYGVTEILYKTCSLTADYAIPQAADPEAEVPKTASGEDLGVGSSHWHTGLGLPPTFSTWSQVTMLHMYLLTVRFRCFPGDGSAVWQQHLLNHFFYDAEDRMTVLHGMHARGTRNKYLKDLFIQWRGLLAAYDEGLARGDAVLASAVWRNVWKADEEIDVRHLASVVAYMRRVLKGLDGMRDEDITTGYIEFGSPGAELEVVDVKNRMMAQPFAVSAPAEKAE
jgi:cytochrome b pre-mRNA-processing protein 3